MSLHRSLVSKSVLRRDRNVLTRAERVKRLADEGKWKEGESVFGLAKVRMRKVRAGAKHKKAEKAAEPTAKPEGAEAAAEEGKKGKKEG
jgi:small basic protein (TIGR04137 family)